MEITIRINTCNDCRHFQHSGAFTVGGMRPVCGHRGACYGNHAVVEENDTAVDVMVRTGMSKDSAEKYVAHVVREDKMKKQEWLKEVPMILLTEHKKGDCLHWAHRVPFADWDKPNIPDWCPIKAGMEY